MQAAIMLNAEKVVLAAGAGTTRPRSQKGTPMDGGEGARICMLPHLDAALLFRGTIAVGAAMYTSILLAGTDCVDAAVRTTWPRLGQDLRGQVEGPEPLRGFEAVLAGWSRERGAMVGYAYTPNEEDDPGTLPLLEFVAALPGTGPGLQDQLATFEGAEPTADRVVEVMRLQARAMGEEPNSESCLGRDVCIVKIGSNGMCSSLRQQAFEG